MAGTSKLRTAGLKVNYKWWPFYGSELLAWFLQEHKAPALEVSITINKARAEGCRSPSTNFYEPELVWF
jgi:hypothetical protein